MTETQNQPIAEKPLSEYYQSEPSQSETSLTLSGELPEGITTRNAGLLSLKDIEVRLDANYSRLQRFANAPGIGDHLGALKVPGAKGVRYEPCALDVFRRLLAASDANAVTPATATAWLELNKEVQPKEVKSPEEGSMAAAEQNAIAEKPLSGHSLTEQGQMGIKSDFGFATKLLSGVLAPITAVLKDLAGEIQGMRADRKMLTGPPAAAQPPADRLLTAEEAAALLACKPRSVGRHVPPVSESPRRFRESDVLRHIAGLTPITKHDLITKTEK